MCNNIFVLYKQKISEKKKLECVNESLKFKPTYEVKLEFTATELPEGAIL